MQNKVKLLTAIDSPNGIKLLTGVLLLNTKSVDDDGKEIDVVRLYLNPRLQEWIDIDPNDVIDEDKTSEDAGNPAADILKIATTMVWVKGNATLHYKGAGNLQFSAESLGATVASLVSRQNHLAGSVPTGDFADGASPDFGGGPTSTFAGPC